jgi:SAM-dependent methyltransferase
MSASTSEPTGHRHTPPHPSSHQHGHTHGIPHDHDPDDDFDIAAMFTPAYWDDRYGAADRLWSGNVNPHVATVAGDLAPGTALDVGCGEGADAIWLAERGWRVTGVDISTVALDRAAAQAAEIGADVAGRTTWAYADVLTWDPAPHRYDLVSAQFIHVPRPELTALHRRLAAAVRPGGTLLIVGHHPSDLHRVQGRARLAELMFTAEEMATVLDPDAWDIRVGTPERPGTGPDGEPVTHRDAVVHAVRTA